MDAALILETGSGDLRFSRPAVEWQMSERVAGLKLSSITRLVEGGWDSQRFEVEAAIWDGASLTLQYFTGTQGHGKDTVQGVAKFKLRSTPITLTTSYSPNAFNAGPRYRAGIQAYYRIGDVSAWGWATTRYFERFNAWDQEYWASLNYHLSETKTVSLRRFNSDFFGDNVTVRLTKRF